MPQKEKLLEFLSGFISENKKNLFQNNIEHRTKYMTVVLEDIFQSHNASAVMRSCDCFGIQDIHVIENRNTYELNPEIAMGSSHTVLEPSTTPTRRPGTRPCKMLPVASG